MIYPKIVNAKTKGEKLFILLIDPDKTSIGQLERTLLLAAKAGVDLILVGSSLLMNNDLDHYIRRIKLQSPVPVVLFPGNAFQLSNEADGILLLSLISGRNPELLIGQHVIAAPFLWQSDLEVMPTGYMLIDGGVPTSVSYISNTTPIPANKKDIALCTAMAGQLMGLRLIYMDAGSGAKHAISPTMISTVSQTIQVPLIVGGGIRTPKQALQAVQAGADAIVVGNALEESPELLLEMVAAVRSLSLSPSAQGVNNSPLEGKEGKGERL